MRFNAAAGRLYPFACVCVVFFDCEELAEVKDGVGCSVRFCELYVCLDAWTGVVISSVFGFVGLVQNLVRFYFWITLFSSDCLTSLAVNLEDSC